jgi:hypothetical protein
MAEPKLVNSPVNSMKRSSPAPNAPSLRTTNPKSAQPSAGVGPKAPLSSASVSMPAVPGFEQPDCYHPSGGRNR